MRRQRWKRGRGSRSRRRLDDHRRRRRGAWRHVVGWRRVARLWWSRLRREAARAGHHRCVCAPRGRDGRLLRRRDRRHARARRSTDDRPGAYARPGPEERREDLRWRLQHVRRPCRQDGDVLGPRPEHQPVRRASRRSLRRREPRQRRRALGRDVAYVRARRRRRRLLLRLQLLRRARGRHHRQHQEGGQGRWIERRQAARHRRRGHVCRARERRRIVLGVERHGPARPRQRRQARALCAVGGPWSHRTGPERRCLVGSSRGVRAARERHHEVLGREARG